MKIQPSAKTWFNCKPIAEMDSPHLINAMVYMLAPMFARYPCYTAIREEIAKRDLGEEMLKKLNTKIDKLRREYNNER